MSVAYNPVHTPYPSVTAVMLEKLMPTVIKQEAKQEEDEEEEEEEALLTGEEEEEPLLIGRSRRISSLSQDGAYPGGTCCR